MYRYLLEHFAVCLMCEQPLSTAPTRHHNTTQICSYCETQLPLLPFGTDIMTTTTNEALMLTHVDGVCAAMLYQWPVTAWVSGLKFGKKSEFANTLGFYMARQLEQQAWIYDLRCATPLHPFRQLKRGYNQAALLLTQIYQNSHSLGPSQDLESFSSVVDTNQYSQLKRRRYTRPQAKLNQYARRQNVHNVFVCKQPILNKSVVLVDDVLTTGNTINEAAKALKNAGADKVYAVCAALKVMD